MSLKTRIAVMIAAAALAAATHPARAIDDLPGSQTKNVPTPKDPLFPGFFVNFYLDDVPTTGLLFGVYKTYAQASSKAAVLRRGPHVVKVEIEWVDDDNKKHLDLVGRSKEQLTRIAQALSGRDRRSEYQRTPGGMTRCNKFVRDFAKELFGGRALPELEGTANEQYERLKASANVEKLWLPDGHEADLAAARQALENARRLETQRVAAAREGKADRARELEQQRDIERYTAREKADALQDAFQAAQLRANNQGDLVLVVWKSGPSDHGHIAVVVPSPENGTALAPSGDWGLMNMPHIAQAGNDVFPDKTLNYGFPAVGSIENIAIFAIPNT